MPNKNPKEGMEPVSDPLGSRKTRGKAIDGLNQEESKVATVANVNKRKKTNRKGDKSPEMVNVDDEIQFKSNEKTKPNSRSVILADSNNNSSAVASISDNAKRNCTRSSELAETPVKKVKTNTDSPKKSSNVKFSKNRQKTGDSNSTGIVGIQTSGVLREFRVGPSMNDGILLDVDTHEFDLDEEENGMAASDESSSDEAEPIPKRQLCSTVQLVEHPVASTSAGVGTAANGSEAMMKKLFDEWMSERMPQLMQQGNTQDIPTRDTGKVITGTPKGVGASPVVKSPSDTTIYAPLFQKAQVRMMILK